MSFNPEIKTIPHITLDSVQKYISDEYVGYDEAREILRDNVRYSEETIGVNYATIMTIPNFIDVMKFTMKWNIKGDEFIRSRKKMEEVIERLKQEDPLKVFVWLEEIKDKYSLTV